MRLVGRPALPTPLHAEVGDDAQLGHGQAVLLLVQVRQRALVRLLTPPERVASTHRPARPPTDTPCTRLKAKLCVDRPPPPHAK